MSFSVNAQQQRGAASLLHHCYRITAGHTQQTSLCPGQAYEEKQGGLSGPVLRPEVLEKVRGTVQQ